MSRLTRNLLALAAGVLLGAVLVFLAVAFAVSAVGPHA